MIRPPQIADNPTDAEMLRQAWGLDVIDAGGCAPPVLASPAAGLFGKLSLDPLQDRDDEQPDGRRVVGSGVSSFHAAGVAE